MLEQSLKNRNQDPRYLHKNTQRPGRNHDSFGIASVTAVNQFRLICVRDACVGSTSGTPERRRAAGPLLVSWPPALRRDGGGGVATTYTHRYPEMHTDMLIHIMPTISPLWSTQHLNNIFPTSTLSPHFLHYGLCQTWWRVMLTKCGWNDKILIFMWGN